jgi:S1-C subfamily serine protease
MALHLNRLHNPSHTTPQVTLNDGATFTAKLVGFDAPKDIAVLRLSMPKV